MGKPNLFRFVALPTGSKGNAAEIKQRLIIMKVVIKKIKRLT